MEWSNVKTTPHVAKKCWEVDEFMFFKMKKKIFLLLISKIKYLTKNLPNIWPKICLDSLPWFLSTIIFTYPALCSDIGSSLQSYAGEKIKKKIKKVASRKKVWYRGEKTGKNVERKFPFPSKNGKIENCKKLCPLLTTHPDNKRLSLHRASTVKSSRRTFSPNPGDRCTTARPPDPGTRPRSSSTFAQQCAASPTQPNTTNATNQTWGGGGDTVLPKLSWWSPSKGPFSVLNAFKEKKVRPSWARQNGQNELDHNSHFLTTPHKKKQKQRDFWRNNKKKLKKTKYDWTALHCWKQVLDSIGLFQ